MEEKEGERKAMDGEKPARGRATLLIVSIYSRFEDLAGSRSNKEGYHIHYYYIMKAVHT